MPQDPASPPKRSAITDSVARYERVMQIAFVMPASIAVGWLIGYGLDKWLHQHWIYLAGIILGLVAGFIEVIRSAVIYSKQVEKEDRNG